MDGPLHDPNLFPGEPLNETDLLLNGVPDRETRQRLIFDFTDAKWVT
ncbi:MAG: hypothetical protein WDO18_12870 [Acidobacteriota bacterium]